MRRKYPVLASNSWALLLACLLGSGWEQSSRAQGTGQSAIASRPSYEELLKRVKETDSGVSFREFRLAYADSSQYAASSDGATRKAMFAALNAKDYAKALELAELILKDRYVDIYAHQTASVAYRELGKRAEGSIHASLARELIRSIVDSGDGNSPQTAMLLISEEEESVILNALQLRMVSQELQDVDGHTYDRVEAVDSGDGTVVLFFNLDVPVAKMREALSKIKN